MGLFDNFFEDASLRFTPDDLPANYKALMLLALMDVDFSIYKICGFEKAGTAMEKARRSMFSFAQEFVFAQNNPLIFEDFVSFAETSLGVEPFELRLRLARIFFDSLAKMGEKPAALKLATLLEDDGRWQKCVEAAVLCGIFQRNAPNPAIAARAGFFLKNLLKTEESVNGEIFPMLSPRRTLYFFHYCHYSASHLFSDKPDENEYGSLCQFIFELYAKMHDKLIASMAAIRLYLIFSQKCQAAQDADIAEIRKKALFDRSRKAFSINDSRQVIFVTPDEEEKKIIF